MLSEAPGTPPDIGEITSRAGMKRSNFYTYFGSRADLVVAVAEDLMPRWISSVSAAIEEAGPGRPGALAFVHATLELVAAGEHAVLTALAAQLPEGPARDALHRMHAEMTTPLREALAADGSPDPQLSADLVVAVTFKASELIESGRDPGEVRAAVDDLLDPAL